MFPGHVFRGTEQPALKLQGSNLIKIKLPFDKGFQELEITPVSARPFLALSLKVVKVDIGIPILVRDSITY